MIDEVLHSVDDDTHTDRRRRTGRPPEVEVDQSRWVGLVQWGALPTPLVVGRA